MYSAQYRVSTFHGTKNRKCYFLSFHNFFENIFVVFGVGEKKTRYFFVFLFFNTFSKNHITEKRHNTTQYNTNVLQCMILPAILSYPILSILPPRSLSILCVTISLFFVGQGKVGCCTRPRRRKGQEEQGVDGNAPSSKKAGRGGGG